MILKNNIKVTELLMYFSLLDKVDKLKLGVNLLESKYLHINIDKNNAITLLQRLLSIVDNTDITKIVNFSENQTLTFLASKFMELDAEDKNKFIFEMIFEIYKTIFIAL